MDEQGLTQEKAHKWRRNFIAGHAADLLERADVRFAGGGVSEQYGLCGTTGRKNALRTLSNGLAHHGPMMLETVDRLYLLMDPARMASVPEQDHFGPLPIGLSHHRTSGKRMSHAKPEP